MTNITAETVRAKQSERSAALLNADVQAAESIHADDFQLITPLGAVFSKEQYLGAVAAGIIRYTALELDSPVDARVYGEVAVLRYRTQIEVEVQGQLYPRAAYWFTDVYEKWDEQWQIVWSQGTGVTS
jgi:ketosteroid isomerase-like protein